MVDKNSNIDYELITSYLAGEASDEEAFRVEQWRDASEENRNAFKQVEILWEQASQVIPHEKANVDVNSGWERFKNKIRSENNGEKFSAKPTKSLFYYFSRVAALLFIGISLYLIYQKRTTPAVEKTFWITDNKIVTDTLPDGSLISMNAYSKLSFPETFGEDNRPVTLKGEAFFQVTPDSKRPFIVELDGANVIVLGTSFYVEAYDSLNWIEVGVKEGKVKVEISGSHVVLTAGESISINRSTKEISSVEPFNPNDLYWKSKTLIFQNDKLKTVFETLEKHYNIKVTVENQKVLNCRLTAKFHNEDIDRVFDIINTNFNLTSENKANSFIVSGSGCN